MELTKEQSEAFESELEAKGYLKINAHHRNADYMFVKTFKENNKGICKGIYQILHLMYDFPEHKKIKCVVCSECNLLLDCRIDLTYSNDFITIDRFEDISKHFYNSMKLILDK